MTEQVRRNGQAFLLLLDRLDGMDMRSACMIRGSSCLVVKRKAHS